MAKIDLHNFFKFYDDKNNNHVKAVQWLEDNLPKEFLEEHAEWAEIYRKKQDPLLLQLLLQQVVAVQFL